jgi:MraZ protein
MQINGFIGKAKATIDSKGRVSFPKELRKYLLPENENTIVVSLGPEKSLTLYPLKEWNDFISNLEDKYKISRDRKIAKLRKVMTASAKESILDKQFRISLSKELLTFASIDSEILFAADGNTVGLWKPEHYDQLNAVENDDFDDLFFESEAL